LIVDADGNPLDIQVQKPVGFGLEDVGAAVLREWRFVPGTREGKPVCVAIRVEVSWHLYY
jgi:Gram-negative bacterial tonB protein.